MYPAVCSCLYSYSRTSLVTEILSSLFSGSTVTAMVLNMQIQGPVLFKALQSQDMYLAGAIVMVQAVLVVIGILFSDIVLAFLDPRIRYSGGGR